MKRPPLISSIVSLILATRPGLRNPVQATSDPIWMSGTALARAAIVVKHSQTPRSSWSEGMLNWLPSSGRKMKWSMIQTVSKPALAAACVMARMSAKCGVASEGGLLRDRQDDAERHRARAGGPAGDARVNHGGAGSCSCSRLAWDPFLLTSSRGAGRRGHGCGPEMTKARSGASSLLPVDRTANSGSLQWAVDPARGRGLHEPGAAQQGEHQPDDGGDELLPAEADAAAGEVELVREERSRGSARCRPPA